MSYSFHSHNTKQHFNFITNKSAQKMDTFCSCLLLIVSYKMVITQEIYETDMNFRVEAGTRTCFFEKGEAGQMMELFYQVLDGQSGDLDISVDVIDPTGTKIISDHKKSQNSIILDLEHDGEYVLCLDNTYSIINSKLVFVYVVIENKTVEKEAEVSVINHEGEEEKEILEWMGIDDKGNNYTLEVDQIALSLKHTLNNVVRARHMLDMYSASKTRDSYRASADTFIVDLWSAFQIIFMASVGMLQVYMIKKLFDGPSLKQQISHSTKYI